MLQRRNYLRVLWWFISGRCEGVAEISTILAKKNHGYKEPVLGAGI